MTQARHEMTTRRVVYSLPEEEAVQVQRGIAYAPSLVMDLYRPIGCSRLAMTPAVILVNGYSDPRAQATLGCRIMEMAAFDSWARLMAVSGLAAISYSTGTAPADDLRALFTDLHEHGSSLGIDAERIGVWACSGHVPTALSALIEQHVRCAVLCYGYFFGDAVADAAAQFGFANPVAGRDVGDLPVDVPVLVVKAGQDAMPHLNDTLHTFVAEASARGLPIEMLAHAFGPHAFDLLDDSEESQTIVKKALTFMRGHLR
jgi:hypothetical protein